MKISLFLLLVTINCITIAQPASVAYRETGIASFYANSFHGLLTANGEIFNTYDFTAAHPTLPFNTFLLVTNLENGKNTVVRVNDRGPYKKKRIIDLSRSAARRIGMISDGVINVDVQELNVIDLSTEKKEKFLNNSVLDLDGKKKSLQRTTIKVWGSAHLEHVMYMLINLKLNFDYEDMYIYGNGRGMARRYSIVITNIKNKDMAHEIIKELTKEGFKKASII